MLTSWYLNEKSREVCIKARSPLASLVFIAQATKHTTQIKKIAYSVTFYYCDVVHVDFLHRLILSMETNIKSVDHVVAEVELLYTCCSVSLYLNWSLAWATNQEIPT